MLKKILLVLVVVLVIMQFIRPQKNIATSASANDIRTRFDVPAQVDEILQRACNDCHSNNTNYPWYANIQPLGWWLQNHINEGKDELNFSEFALYTPKKQAHKMEELAELVEEGEMPLESYTILHGNAKLTEKEKETLVVWAKTLEAQIKSANNL